MSAMQHNAGCADPHHAKKVVVVNSGPDTLGTLLDPRHYDTMVVESGEDAYSLVRHMLPDHVIVCMRIDDHEVLSLLSLLAFDAETRGIPTSICITQLDDEKDSDEEQLTGMDELAIRSPLTMH